MKELKPRVIVLIALHPEWSIEQVINSIHWDDFVEVWRQDMVTYPATIGGYIRAMNDGKLTKISAIMREIYRIRAAKRLEAEKLNLQITI